MEINIGPILTAIFVPIFVSLVFTLIQISNAKMNNNLKMSDKHFIIRVSPTVSIIGIILDSMCVIIILGFTFFSREPPNIIFYVVFGLFLWLGTYLILKTLRFKVIVKDYEITAHNIFRKSYTFTFDEIVSIVRQIKKNNVKSERIVLKTSTGKKLIVESSEIGYKKFIKAIQSEVKSEKLFGFK